MQGDPKHQKGKKKAPEKPVTSNTSTDHGDGQRSPPYQKSRDNSSAKDDGDGGGAGGGGGGIHFTGIQTYNFPTCMMFLTISTNNDLG
jgi:hypothetical protein